MGQGAINTPAPRHRGSRSVRDSLPGRIVGDYSINRGDAEARRFSWFTPHRPDKLLAGGAIDCGASDALGSTLSTHRGTEAQRVDLMKVGIFGASEVRLERSYTRDPKELKRAVSQDRGVEVQQKPCRD